VAAALRQNTVIGRNATIQAKGHQIAIELNPKGDASAILDETTRTVHDHAVCGNIAIVTSSHSVDVIAGGVSKLNVVARLVHDLNLADGGTDSVLCIGDRGRAPGNDAELLSHSLSLTVDQASDDPVTCWNLAQAGLRFDLACIEYLTRLRQTTVCLRFDVKGVRK
jgi:hypothetical protein